MLSARTGFSRSRLANFIARNTEEGGGPRCGVEIGRAKNPRCAGPLVSFVDDNAAATDLLWVGNTDVVQGAHDIVVHDGSCDFVPYFDAESVNAKTPQDLPIRRRQQKSIVA